MKGAAWANGQRSDLDVAIEDLPALANDPARLVWIDLCGLSTAQLQQVGASLRLDAHSLEDAQAPNERPKTTRFADYTFATVYGASLSFQGDSASRVRLSRVSVYCLPSCLLTVRNVGGFDMTPVEQRWADDPKLPAFGVDGLAQGLLDVAIDQQFDVLQALDDDAETLTGYLFGDNPDVTELQRRTFVIRREAVEMRRVVSPMRDVVSSLIRAGVADRGWNNELLSYYEDLNDHVMRAVEWLDGLRDLVTSIFESGLALNDNRANQVMKKLAGWAAIIAVPTLITGWFGMNVPYFGFDTTAGFIGSSVAILGGACTLWVVMRKKGWI